jgi:hypothetical protein
MSWRRCLKSSFDYALAEPLRSFHTRYIWRLFGRYGYISRVADTSQASLVNIWPLTTYQHSFSQCLTRKADCCGIGGLQETMRATGKVELMVLIRNYWTSKQPWPKSAASSFQMLQPCTGEHVMYITPFELTRNTHFTMLILSYRCPRDVQIASQPFAMPQKDGNVTRGFTF